MPPPRLALLPQHGSQSGWPAPPLVSPAFHPLIPALVASASTPPPSPGPAFWKTGRSKKSTAQLVVAGGLTLAAFVLLSTLFRGAPLAPVEECDVLRAPGRLLLNLTSPLETHWRPFDELICPPLPAYLPGLWSLLYGSRKPLPGQYPSTETEAYRSMVADPAPPPPPPSLPGAPPMPDPVAFLRRARRASTPPTVLILGDSVDRNALVHFCQLFEQDVSISHYLNVSSHPPDTEHLHDLTFHGHGSPHEGWDQRGLPHRCEIPFVRTNGAKREVALRAVNSFHYGMDAMDEFNTDDRTDWHAPGRFEDRVEQLFTPLIEQMGGPDSVDLILLHSGMWDLTLLGIHDHKTSHSLDLPLKPEQLAWWHDRMRDSLASLRTAFPKARIVLRKIHRTDHVILGTQFITNSVLTNSSTSKKTLPNSKVSPSSVRPFPSLAFALTALADMSHVFEGYQAFQEHVHPYKLPAGVLYAQNLLHQLRIAVEEKERSRWRSKVARVLGR